MRISVTSITTKLLLAMAPLPSGGKDGRSIRRRMARYQEARAVSCALAPGDQVGNSVTRRLGNYVTRTALKRGNSVTLDR